MNQVEKALSHSDDQAGLSTGFRCLDRILWGLKPAELIVLASRSDMDTTSLALNIAGNVAVGGDAHTGFGAGAPHPVGLIGLEMSSEELVRRMVFSRAGVPMRETMEGGRISRSQYEKLNQAANEVSEAPVFIEDTVGLPSTELRSSAIRMREKHGIQLLVIDSRPFHCGNQMAVSAVLKGMAKELRIPVLALASWVGESTSRRPHTPLRLFDLRAAGFREEDVDVVLFLHRARRRLAGKESPGETGIPVSLDVAKNRNGQVGSASLSFREDCYRFDEQDKADS